MRRPLASKRPIGPFAQSGGVHKPVIRMVPGNRPDKSEIAKELDKTDLSTSKKSKVLNNIDISKRERARDSVSDVYDVTLPIGGLSYEDLIDMENVIDEIVDFKSETFFECEQ